MYKLMFLGDSSYGSKGERVIILIVFAVLLLAPWMLGGRAEGAWMFLGAFSWSAFGIHLATGKQMVALRPKSIDFWKCALWGLWFLWMIPWGISVFNPSAHASLSADGVLRLQHEGAIPLLPSSVYAWRTFEHGFLLSGCMVLAYSAYRVFNQRRLVLGLLTAVLGNGVVLSILGLYFDAVGTELIFGRFEAANRSFFSSFNYHNHWGVYALIALSCTFVVWEVKRLRGSGPGVMNRNILFAAMALVLAFSIIVAGGRFCLLGLGVLLSAFIVRLLLSEVTKNSYRILIFCSVLLCGCGALWLAGESFLERFEMTRIQFTDVYEGNLNDTRFYAAPRDTIRMALDNPIWGWGLGSYLYVFRDYAGQEFYIPHHDEIVLVWMEAAHNDWLQLWAEVGFVGFFTILTFVFGFVVYCVKQGKRNVMAQVFILLFFVIGLIALFDFPMANPAIALHVWVLGALTGRYTILEKQRALR